jgi:hypothetical protein
MMKEGKKEEKKKKEKEKKDAKSKEKKETQKEKDERLRKQKEGSLVQKTMYEKAAAEQEKEGRSGFRTAFDKSSSAPAGFDKVMIFLFRF